MDVMSKIDILSDEFTLFHASREGIVGDISLKSKETCDLGKRFYLGFDKQNLIGRAIGGKNPKMYEIKIDLKSINKDKILFLSGVPLIYCVMAFRLNREYKEDNNFFKIPYIKNISIFKDLRDYLDTYDVVICNTIDDYLNEYVKMFARRFITEKYLLYLMLNTGIDYQFVVMNQDTCNKLQIVNEEDISMDVIEDYKVKSVNKKIKMREFAARNKAEFEYLFNGKKINGILKDINKLTIDSMINKIKKNSHSYKMALLEQSIGVFIFLV